MLAANADVTTQIRDYRLKNQFFLMPILNGKLTKKRYLGILRSVIIYKNHLSIYHYELVFL